MALESFEFEQINLFEFYGCRILGGWYCGSVPNLIISMASKRALLQEDTNFRILHMLQANPDLTQREIAQKLGVSTSGLNYCLKALIERGLVKVQNFSQSKNKFGYVYLLTPKGVAEKALLTGRFLRRKMVEYEALRAEIENLSTVVASSLTVERFDQGDKNRPLI